MLIVTLAALAGVDQQPDLLTPAQLTILGKESNGTKVNVDARLLQAVLGGKKRGNYCPKGLQGFNLYAAEGPMPNAVLQACFEKPAALRLAGEPAYTRLTVTGQFEFKRPNQYVRVLLLDDADFVITGPPKTPAIGL